LNKTADYYRSQVHQRSRIVAPTLELLASIKDNGLMPDEQLAIKELRAAIKECLLILPKEKRQLLYMRYWQNLTLEKIASILGISERSVEGKLYRAKLALREEISQNYPEYSR
jgi:RNA polymerase sigma-70 factor (ECF subfamily)